MQQYNEFRMKQNLQAIARDLFTTGGLGSTADEAIGSIAEIRSLGGAGSLALLKCLKSSDLETSRQVHPLCVMACILTLY